MENKKEASLLAIFKVFAKIGAFTIGGGYAMIPIIENEMEKRGWVKGEELDDIVVLAQSAPGLLAVNMAVFTGNKIRGMKGSMAAVVGAVLPSFIAILVIAMAFTAFQENPWVIRFFKGLRPVAVGMILVPMVKMARKSCRKWWHWAILIASLISIAFLRVSPIYILLVIIVSSTAILSVMEGRNR